MDHPVVRYTGDGVSLTAIVGTLVGLLPAIAAVAAFVWYLIQIYESPTCQKWLERVRVKRKTARIAKLKAEHRVLVAELEALEVVREARVVAEDKVAVASHEAAVLLATESVKSTRPD